MKQVLVLGAGMVSSPLVHYLLDRGYAVTLGDINEEAAQNIIGDKANATALKLDISESERVSALVAEADLIISLLPPKFHTDIAAMSLEHGKNFLTASYLSDEMKTMHEQVKAKGLVFMNEVGLDPGIDHLTAMEMIDEARDEGYKILSFDSHCGGIPSRKSANNPLRYKFSWSPAGVLGAITRASRFRREGNIVQVPGREKLHHAEVLHVPGAGIFESNPNADSLYYGDHYGLTETHNVRRGTLRYPGWAQFWLFMLKLDFLDRERRMTFENEPAINALFQLAEWTVPKDIYKFVHEKADSHASLFLEYMESLGLLDNENRVTGDLTAFEIMLQCALKNMQYEEGETDLVILHHELIVEKDGKREKWSSTMNREGESGGLTAMAVLVGIPAAITARMILEDRIAEKGVLIPLAREVYKPILDELAELGIPHHIRKNPIN